MSEEHDAKPKGSLGKVFSSKIWQIATVALVVILAVSVVTQGFSFTGQSSGNGQLSSQQAATKAITYVNNLLEGQSTATLLNVTESNGLYKIAMSVGGQLYDSYITKDGALLFPSAYAMPATVTPTNNTTTTTTTSYPKTDKPVVDLYVMAFCPYGVQAEDAMKPVVDLLGDDVAFNVKFIVNIGGNTTADVQSLHGAPEAMEDLRQVCIREGYSQTVFWKYVSEINANCYSIYRNDTQMDTCWKAAAATAGVNATAIEQCVTTSSVTFIGADAAASDENSVTGSPTLIINGKKYSGARSSDGFKQAICSAFTTAPEACGEALSSDETAASGGCGA